jgi:RRXRR protein
MRRIPVVDSRGVPLMPCHPAKACLLCKSGKARPRRNKLGLFYVQLCHAIEPNNHPLVAGVDPGSKFEGFSVVGTQETVLNLMVEVPDHVKKAIQRRRTMRRARRFRKWRRPKRFNNRLRGKKRLLPSTRSCWEAKARVIAHLQTILPLSDVVVEDVQAVTCKGKSGKFPKKWNGAFSLVQVGKAHLYQLLYNRGLTVHLSEGWQTKELREKHGTITLNAYRTNKRLTQDAKVEKCRVLTWVAFRSWLVGKTSKPEKKQAGNGKPPSPSTPTSPKGTPVSSRRVNANGSPQASK